MSDVIMPTRRYLAYGSNLHPLRIIDRVPSARLLGDARLEGYKVTFVKKSRDGSTKCNLLFTSNPDDVAYGAVYEIAINEKRLLDAAEGLGKGYMETLLQVDVNSATVDVFTYVASLTHLAPGLPPYDWYKAMVIAGARYHGFPSAYIDSLAAIPSQSDPNPRRNHLNQNLLIQLENYELRRRI
jgi:gamma-glutamylcyclotransferase